MSQVTIAIPTFERPEKLGRIVTAILPQLTEEDRLIIIDNASSNPLPEILLSLQANKDPRVEVVINPYNVGMSGNILRCFEHCGGQWLHIVGDDDIPESDFVSSIKSEQERHPDACLINFSSNLCTRSETTEVRGLKDFIAKMDSWSNVLFISASSFNLPRVAPFLRFGYNYAYTMAPFVAMVIEALKLPSATAVYSSRKVIECTGGTEVDSWPRILLSNNFFLLELIPDRTSQRLFLDKLRPFYLPLWIAAWKLHRRQLLSGEDLLLSFNIRAWLSTYPAGIATRLKVQLLRLLFRFPRIAELVTSLLRKLLGRDTREQLSSTLHSRM